MEGDDKRYAELKATIGDNLFAAYDPLDMKAAKYLIMASSDYLYKPRSLFWPEVGLGTVSGHDNKHAKGSQHGAASESDCRLE